MMNMYFDFYGERLPCGVSWPRPTGRRPRGSDPRSWREGSLGLAA